MGFLSGGWGGVGGLWWGWGGGGGGLGGGVCFFLVGLGGGLWLE